MKPTLVSSLKTQIERLLPLVTALKSASSLLERLDILNNLPSIQNYLQEPGPIHTFLAGLTPECDYAIKSIIAIGQAPIVFNMKKTGDDRFEKLRVLLHQLLDVERFYQPIGGIVGYHWTVLNLIECKSEGSHDSQFSHYIHPEGLKLDVYNQEIKKIIRYGIESLPFLAEIYPVGGAGDRLNLIDSNTGAALPAALLPFLGRSLLEGLIRDLQAREYLYFKLFNKQLVTPVAMMTSWEKNNHAHIQEICQSHQWFGRSPENFFLFVQPLVPVLTIEGNWSLASPLTLNLKPGGHGVIWKLAQDQGVFEWLYAGNRTKSIVRQINNPLAGTDYNLFALLGYGCQEDKAFGFISCKRLLKTSEGVNVIIKTKTEEGYDYCLTNIEYTDFSHKGIEEVPSKPEGRYSIYPTNTNILFANLPRISEALKECSIPGQLVNMKNKVSYIDSEGHQFSIEGGRLETTMQNIADCLVDFSPFPLKGKEFLDVLQTFILYNARIKTISTTKNTYKSGQSPHSTPEEAFYDLMRNHFHLLRHNCLFEVPELNTIEDYLENGPTAIFIFHPALGPLYSVIGQKIRKGRLEENAELQLEIAEVDIEDLEVNGSLLIESVSPLGQINSKGVLEYGNENRCRLHQVKVHNQGIRRNLNNYYWKNQIERNECVRFILHPGAEIDVQGVQFEGSFVYEVPANHCLTIRQNKDGSLVEKLRAIQSPSWAWQYAFDSDDSVILTRIQSLI